MFLLVKKKSFVHKITAMQQIQVEVSSKHYINHTVKKMILYLKPPPLPKPLSSLSSFPSLIVNFVRIHFFFNPLHHCFIQTFLYLFDFTFTIKRFSSLFLSVGGGRGWGIKLFLKAREIIRIWTKRAWNYSLISRVYHLITY